MQKDRSAKPPTAMIIAEASLVRVSRIWGFKAEGLDLKGLGFRSQWSVPELDDETSGFRASRVSVFCEVQQDEGQ